MTAFEISSLIKAYLFIVKSSSLPSWIKSCLWICFLLVSKCSTALHCSVVFEVCSTFFPLAALILIRLNLLRFMKTKANFRIRTKLWKSAILSWKFVSVSSVLSEAEWTGFYLSVQCGICSVLYSIAECLYVYYIRASLLPITCAKLRN